MKPYPRQREYMCEGLEKRKNMINLGELIEANRS